MKISLLGTGKDESLGLVFLPKSIESHHSWNPACKFNFQHLRFTLKVRQLTDPAGVGRLKFDSCIPAICPHRCTRCNNNPLSSSASSDPPWQSWKDTFGSNPRETSGCNPDPYGSNRPTFCRKEEGHRPQTRIRPCSYRPAWRTPRTCFGWTSVGKGFREPPRISPKLCSHWRPSRQRYFAGS